MGSLRLVDSLTILFVLWSSYTIASLRIDVINVPHVVEHLWLGMRGFVQAGVGSGKRDYFCSSSSRRSELSNKLTIQAVRHGELRFEYNSPPHSHFHLIRTYRQGGDWVHDSLPPLICPHPVFSFEFPILLDVIEHSHWYHHAGDHHALATRPIPSKQRLA